MAIAHVISWARQAVAPGDPVNFSAVDTTGANFVAVVVGYFPDNAGANTTELVTITDNKSSSFQRAGSRTTISGSDCVEIWYAMNVTGGAGHTISVDFEGSTFASACAAAYSGLATTSALDQTTGATGSGTALNSGGVSTTTANQLFIGGGTHVNVGVGEDLFVAGTNFTIRAQYSSSTTSATSYLEDRIVSATGTYDASATSPGSGNWAARIATFKEPTGAAYTPRAMLLGVG